MTVQKLARWEGAADGGNGQGEFESYELHQMAAYLDSIGHSIRKGTKN